MSAKNMMINGFLSDLAVMNIKVHNLHWNVVGMEFRKNLYVDGGSIR